MPLWMLRLRLVSWRRDNPSLCPEQISDKMWERVLGMLVSNMEHRRSK
jgi:hypothetical protein